MAERILNIAAKTENLDQVLGFIDSFLEEQECDMKAMIQIDVAVEEMYVNIAHYAYGVEGGGDAEIRVELDELYGKRAVRITFIDSGIYYDPLAKEDPDITLGAEERPIGGLGIFMVKKSMDDVAYERKDERNYFTMKKLI
ncbi:MAG: ATP-binding protein [Lachnospiraceae bacterium]|nr:ATP-binding protein [Lachnospiraceae bacterium]MBR1914790.1 ATP-binding protein [Lachnospiraceae bacterium]